MASSLSPDELNRLPGVREDARGFFDYRLLSADANPPAGLVAHHRLARSEASDTGEEGGAGRLRLAFVTGYDADAGWLDCLAYVWRPESRDAVWALERWERAPALLRLYTRDPGFASQALDGVHQRLRERGDDGVAEQVREILSR